MSPHQSAKGCVVGLRRVASIGLMLFFEAAGPTCAADAPPSLFGFQLGQPFALKKAGFAPVNEERDYYLYGRKSKNGQYALQNVGISKISGTIVRVNGSAFHKNSGSCESQLKEAEMQLKERYPDLSFKIREAEGVYFHMLSEPRSGCEYQVAGIKKPLQCEINFMLYCSPMREIFRFHIEAGDTGISELARTESIEAAARTVRKHLD